MEVLVPVGGARGGKGRVSNQAREMHPPPAPRGRVHACRGDCANVRAPSNERTLATRTLGDVPCADQRVVRPGQQLALLMRVPSEPISLFLVALQNQVRLEPAVGGWLGRVLGPVEHVHLRRGGFGGCRSETGRSERVHTGAAAVLTHAGDAPMRYGFCGMYLARLTSLRGKQGKLIRATSFGPG